MYDRTRDPYEVHNLVDDSSYGEVRAALSSLTQRYRGCRADTCPHDFYPADQVADLVGLRDG